MKIYPRLRDLLDKAEQIQVPEFRKRQLDPLISYLKEKKQRGEPIKLNFICTHNSRRSQLAQLWAKTIAYRYGYSVESFSGGTEVSVLHPNVVETLKRTGFLLKQAENKAENPHYKVSYASEKEALILFSKLYSDSTNPTEGFAAVMTCSEAAEDCPFVVGAEKRIALPYEDPKIFDGSENCIHQYEERSFQIASELTYVFKKL
jgi:arsenate reductase